MTSLNWENIWHVMKNYNFQILTDIDSEMLCVFCKKLLINAHITPCGCRFCFTCISEYLKGEVKYCIGNTEDCKLELISLNDNIAVDNGINFKISKIKVKCPENSCEFNDELRKISDHLRICNYQFIDCPFINIGCNKCEISQDKISDHLQSEILMHTKLLMDFVDNVNNEMNILKANNNDLRDENKILKSEINSIRLDCERRQQEIEQLNNNIIDLKNDGERTQEAIVKYELKCQQRENEDDMIRNIDEMKIIKEIDLMEMPNNIDESIQNVNKGLLEIDENILNNGEFVWKIEKFSDKMANAKNGINTDIYSESFLTHKNGYKMCLRIDPDGYGIGKHTHLSVFLYLLKGDFDYNLEWPFKYDVTFKLINQQTQLAYISRNFKYEDNKNIKAYDKPTDRNSPLGFHKFLNLTELSTNRNLIKNDQIFIKCTINI